MRKVVVFAGGLVAGIGVKAWIQSLRPEEPCAMCGHTPSRARELELAE